MRIRIFQKEKIIAVVIGLIFSFLLIEITFRIVEINKTVTKRWNDRPYKYFLSASAHSLQNQHHNVHKPFGAKRIAVVGDSITFAPFMQAYDAFPAKLETILNLNEHVPSVEVINFGFPGFSTQKEIPIVQKALKEEADLLILQITLNDPEKEVLRGGGNTHFGPYTPSPFLKKIFSYWHSLGFISERVHNTFTHQEYKRYFFDLFNNPETWEIFQTSTERILKIAEQHNVKVVPVLFPLFGFPLDEKYPFKELHDKIKALYKKNNVNLLDLLSSYQNIPISRLQVIPDVDLHPNEIAHRIAAEKLYKFIIKEKLLSDEFKVKRRYSHRENIAEVSDK